MPVPSILVQRPGPAAQRAVDLLAAVAAGLLCWFAAADTSVRASPEPAWVAVLAGVAVGGPLAVRRRWPIVTAVAIAASSSILLITRVIPNAASPAPVTAAGVALYTIGLLVPGRPGGAGAVTATAVLLVGMGFSGSSAESSDSPGAAGVVFAALICGASWAIGWTLRERRRHARITATQSTAQAVAEERLRIAREMHDAVGHSLSLIAVKAAVANHVARQRPEEVGDALEVIESESRGALAELRRVVGALRTEPEWGTPPTLRDLGRLAERAESAGVPVRLDVQVGDDLPESVTAAAYRIVQESLTNVVRHAAPASCRVAVESTGAGLRISVTDDGARRPAPASGGGTGLVGMQERVAAYGGTFSAGPRPGGGFAVVATLPYRSTGGSGKAAAVGSGHRSAAGTPSPAAAAAGKGGGAAGIGSGTAGIGEIGGIGR
ncbi:sensor histidine kinase [Actinoplanes sp. NEAU-A12]|uniref:histidine kinase n=1 Tax=Actinoplanes sandaracinus TaxID=3045177 RepID=A0ABT6WMB7_9ACTN|nr:sensor histidine kinase [Actinoplanes sandaracinus]MDI6100883.1 sensor histidine kinase [Actinoplanes sandaracinus]